jgi:antitoxin VapB
MTLIINDPELDRMAQQLADATGVSVEEAVREAVKAKLKTCGVPRKDPAAVEAALRRLRAMPVLDERTADEIIGYDEYGLPR